MIWRMSFFDETTYSTGRWTSDSSDSRSELSFGSVSAMRSALPFTPTTMTACRRANGRDIVFVIRSPSIFSGSIFRYGTPVAAAIASAIWSSSSLRRGFFAFWRSAAATTSAGVAS